MEKRRFLHVLSSSQAHVRAQPPWLCFIESDLIYDITSPTKLFEIICICPLAPHFILLVHEPPVPLCLSQFTSPHVLLEHINSKSIKLINNSSELIHSFGIGGGRNRQKRQLCFCLCGIALEWPVLFMPPCWQVEHKWKWMVIAWISNCLSLVHIIIPNTLNSELSDTSGVPVRNRQHYEPVGL